MIINVILFLIAITILFAFKDMVYMMIKLRQINLYYGNSHSEKHIRRIDLIREGS